MKISAPSGAYRLPDPGTYRAKLTEYEDLGIQPNPYGQDREKVKLVFDLGSGLKQFHWASPSLHPSSRFYEIATALLGTIPPEVLELDYLIGLECVVDVTHYKAQSGQMRAKISDFRTIPRADARPKPANPQLVTGSKVVTAPKTESNMHGVEVSDDDIPF